MSWPQRAAAEVVALAELERIAVEQRPELAAAAARTRSARFDLEHAQSAYAPLLGVAADGSLGPGRTLSKVTDVNGTEILVQSAQPIDEKGAFSVGYTAQVGVELRGNIYDFGRTGASVDSGRASSHAAEAAEESARKAIVMAVRSAYLQWLAQAELLAIAEQAAEEGRGRSQRVQALIGEGARPKAELSAARADELLSALELERARGELRAARLSLEQAVGKKLSATAEPDRILLAGPHDAGSDKGTTANADDGPTLRALAAQRRAAEANAEALDRQDWPLLSGAAALAARATDQAIFPAYSVGLKFSLPLWDGGGSEAAASAARAHAEALGADLEAERANEREERDRAQLARENAQSRLAAAEALLQVAETRAGEASEAYELGAIDISALSDARALLRRAKTEVLHEQLARAEADLALRSRR